jgi:hypothetical protein
MLPPSQLTPSGFCRSPRLVSSPMNLNAMPHVTNRRCVQWQQDVYL